jgi:pyruvate dehydrogenase E1 component alpha subunit
MESSTSNDPHLISRLYESMYRIRWTETEISRIYPSDAIKSPIHLSIGQEAVSVAVCDVLEQEDIVFGTYRGHALYLAKGGDLKAMMAELYGKIDGCSKGKGGSMHLIDTSVGMMGTSAVVATSIPEAVGYAMAIKYKQSNQVVVCFFGDGATGAGVFHESLNFASLKDLPILFICENNEYAIHSPLSERSSQQELYKFGLVNNIPSFVQKDRCVLTLRSKCNQLVNEIRNGGGPRFFEVYTDRWLEHVGPNEDWDLGYRSKIEKKSWEANDQIKKLANLINLDEKQKIEKKVKKELLEAISFAEKSPFPSEEDLHKDVYK